MIKFTDISTENLVFLGSSPNKRSLICARVSLAKALGLASQDTPDIRGRTISVLLPPGNQFGFPPPPPFPLPLRETGRSNIALHLYTLLTRLARLSFAMILAGIPARRVH